MAHNATTELQLDDAPKLVEDAIIAQLPKVVLHDHLDGGLRPATILELAAEAGYDGLPGEVTELPHEQQAEALERWFFDAANSGDLPTYLTTFAHTCAVMQTAATIERVAREAVEDLAADNVVYAELRFAPEQHQEQGLSLCEVIDAAIRGVRDGEKAAALQGKDITARLLICGMRHASRTAEVAQATVEAIRASKPGASYVVGFDIAGAEAGFPPSQHQEAFDLLRRELIPVTIHAGEAAGVESIEDALVQGATRLGHGARIYEDLGASLDGIELDRVATAVRDRETVLELCPTSNVQTGVCDTLEDHPLPLLHGLGFTCTVNTDNRLVSGTTMTREMQLLAETFQFGYDELFTFTVNAIEHAFISLPERDRILQQVIIPGYERLVGEVEGISFGGDDGSAGDDDLDDDSDDFDA